MTWGAAQLGIGQGVLDAVADGLLEATDELVVLVAVWVDPTARDETAVRIANRDGRAQGDRRCASTGREPDGRRSARREPRHAAEPVLRRRLMRIAAHRDAALRLPARAAAARRVGSRSRARSRRRRSSIVTQRRGRRGLRERRRAAGPRAARAAARRRRSAAHRGRARGVRDGRLPPRPSVDGRGRGLGSRRAARSTCRAGSCSAAAPSACSPTPRARELLAGRGARRARASRCATRASAR